MTKIPQQHDAHVLDGEQYVRDRFVGTIFGEMLEQHDAHVRDAFNDMAASWEQTLGRR